MVIFTFVVALLFSVEVSLMRILPEDPVVFMSLLPSICIEVGVAVCSVVVIPSTPVHIQEKNVGTQIVIKD